MLYKTEHLIPTSIIYIVLTVILLSGCAAPPPVPHKADVPDDRRVSENPAKEMGKAFLHEALLHYQFVKDPEVTGLVNQVGKRIIEGIGSSPDSYHFFVIREDQPNAFAIPGGYIFVFDSLLTQITSVDELAGVLAHEIGHVERNHFFKDEKKIAALDIATIAAILLGGGQIAPLVIAGAANTDVRLHFSRENEAEADSYALRYLKKSGFDPRGLPGFFKSLLQYERFNPQLAPAYMSTHPDLNARLARLEGLLQKAPDTTAEDPLTGSKKKWERIVTILTAQKNAAKGEVPYFETLPAEPNGNRTPDPMEERNHYLLGLTYLKANRPTEAIPEYREAIARNAAEPVYHNDLALAYLRQQNVEQARYYAEQSLRLDPEGAPAHTILGQVEENSGRVEISIAHFQKALQIDPADPFTNLYLSMAYGKKGDKISEAYYSARYLRLNLQPVEAEREFQRAKDLTTEEHPRHGEILREISELEREGI
ncbi:MAG: M48 family metalloprotease [Nitrospirae bacterium]|nr:M48 family metalloprotease [Nitrospirota bacterium]